MTPELLLWFLFGSFATYRISLMVSKEDGPAWIFRKIRNLPPAKSSAHEGLSCQWCMSIWASAAVCGLFAWSNLRLRGPLWVILWLSISAGAIGLNQMWTKGR